MVERFLELVNDFADGKKTVFAKKAGIPQGTFYGYLKGGAPHADHLVRIREAFGVSIDWILTGSGSKLINEMPKDSFDYVPMAKAQISAGGGAFEQEEGVKEYYSFRKDWLSRTVTSTKDAWLLTVTGNSMEPTIYDGDAVMVDLGRTHIVDGNLYAIRLDGTIMVKRLSLRPEGKIRIISDNKFEHESYDAHRKNVHVLAQVVWYARTLVSASSSR